MSYTYAQRKKTANTKADAPRESAAKSRMDALQSGMAKPTAAEMGRGVDLPDAMRARMESSFGADLSAVRLYESQSVADAGAEAITQGSNIAFAPGKLDLASEGGRALLGHELSHVVSQQRGEVTGGGFLNDHALEARADREGAMAARGESVYGGAAAPLSTATAASAAGPMQASRKSRKEQKENMRAAAREMGTHKASDAYRDGGDIMYGGNSGEFAAGVQEEYLKKKLGKKGWKKYKAQKEQDETQFAEGLDALNRKLLPDEELESDFII